MNPNSTRSHLGRLRLRGNVGVQFSPKLVSADLPIERLTQAELGIRYGLPLPPSSRLLWFADPLVRSRSYPWPITPGGPPHYVEPIQIVLPLAGP